MADLSDVESALVSLISSALFPGITYLQGDYQPSAVTTVCKCYRGWPESANLDADLRLGRAHVSVFPEKGMTRNVSRWFFEPVTISAVAPTIAATVAGAVVTLSGTVTAGNVVGLQASSPLRAYAYVCQAGDTLATAAAALAAKVSGATASGAVITLPISLNLTAATMNPQSVLTVTRQQEQGVRVSVWAPTPDARDAIVSLIDNALAGLKNANGFLTRFFAVGAYESARLAYRASYTDDIPARDLIWRRDLCYTVEFCTTLIESDPIMLFGGGIETIGNPAAATQQIGALPPS